MTVRKIIIDSDVIRDHVAGVKHPSTLRVALGMYFAYTTVFNAIELFAGTTSEVERSVLEAAMSPMKILGLNARGARRYADLMTGRPVNRQWQLLIAGLSMESKVPLLTGRPALYRGIRGLVIVSPSRLNKSRTASEVGTAARESRGSGAADAGA